MCTLGEGAAFLCAHCQDHTFAIRPRANDQLISAV